MRVYRKSQKGLASILVTGILVTLLGVIAISFAVIMRHELNKSVQNQTAQTAYYAAESGINDAVSYLKTNPNTNISDCNGLLGPNKPFANTANLSGDNSTKYTCVLINTHPTDLAYQSINANKSQVVKVTPSATMTSIMISWQASDRNKNFFVPLNIAGSLYDESNWSLNKYPPVLEASLYPIPADSKSLSDIGSAQRTFFLYPTRPTGSSNTVSKISYPSAVDGSVQNVGCGATATENFTGSADYDCNVVINNLPSSNGAGYLYYIKLRPIYTAADVKIKSNTNSNEVVTYSNTQAIVDVTAQSSSALKRLQARVDITNLSGGEQQGISASEDNFPNYSLRSANTICKRLQVNPNTNPALAYISSSSAPNCSSEVSLPPAQAPSVITGNADGVSTSAATLHGTVNPNGNNVTDCHFDYGTTTSYGSTAACSPSPGSGTGVVNVSAAVGGLSASTTYHFRLVATNSTGAGTGSDGTFTTPLAGGGSSSTGGGSTSSTGSGGGGGSVPICRIYSVPNNSSTGEAWGNGDCDYAGGVEWQYNWSWTSQGTCTGSGNNNYFKIAPTPGGQVSYQFRIRGWNNSGYSNWVAANGSWSRFGGNPCGTEEPPPSGSSTGSTGGPTSSSTSSTSSTGGSTSSTSSTSSTTGGGGGCGCFVAGTKILTPRGSKPIEQLKLGDVVQSWDIVKQKMIQSRVVQTFKHYSKPTLWLVTSAGSVSTSSVHPFWTDHGWVEAGNLRPGTRVLDERGKFQTVLFTMKGGSRDVYNIQVDEVNHDYFANGLLVHNKIPCD